MYLIFLINVYINIFLRPSALVGGIHRDDYHYYYYLFIIRSTTADSVI